MLLLVDRTNSAAKCVQGGGRGRREAVESPLVTAELLHSVSLYIEKPEHVFIVHSRYSQTCHLFHVRNVKYEMYVK